MSADIPRKFVLLGPCTPSQMQFDVCSCSNLGGKEIPILLSGYDLIGHPGNRALRSGRDSVAGEGPWSLGR